MPVKGPGHQFLARAAFTLDQHRRLSAGDFSNQLTQDLNAFALAQQFVAGILIFGMTQELVDLDQLGVFFGLFKGDRKLLRRKRLGEKRKSAVAHALHSEIDRAKT